MDSRLGGAVSWCPPPVRMSEATLAEQVHYFAGMVLPWVEPTLGSKIEPIEDEV